MITLLASLCLMWGQPPGGDNYTVLAKSENHFSVKQGQQEYQYLVQPKMDAVTLRFQEDDYFLEVTYFGMKTLEEATLQTNFSGETVSFKFINHKGTLLASQEAWEFMDLLEPQVESIFNRWDNISAKEGLSPLGEYKPSVAGAYQLEEGCDGSVQVGLGATKQDAIDELNHNCSNQYHLGCCRIIVCFRKSIFWHCTGVAYGGEQTGPD